MLLLEEKKICAYEKEMDDPKYSSMIFTFSSHTEYVKRESIVYLFK